MTNTSGRAPPLFIWMPINIITLSSTANKSTGGSHFGVFWQTPYGESGVWKRLPAEFLYNHSCTLACMPQGAACSDGNEFTNNDMYDNDCNCVGIPCTGVDCNSPIASYVPYEKCNVTDRVDNRVDNNWLSCKRQSTQILQETPVIGLNMIWEKCTDHLPAGYGITT